MVGEYYERCTDCDNPARQTEFGEWRDRLLALLASFQRCARLAAPVHAAPTHAAGRRDGRHRVPASPSRGTLARSRRPPFTLQRLCELLLNPQRVYTSTRKLMSALEKLLMVTKTIPATPQPSAPRGAAAEAPSAGSGAAGDESGASTSMLSHRNEAEVETTPMEVDHGQ